MLFLFLSIFEYHLNLSLNLKEIVNVFKCLAYIQIIAIERYKFLLKGVVEYNKKDLADSFEEKDFNYVRR